MSPQDRLSNDCWLRSPCVLLIRNYQMGPNTLSIPSTKLGPTHKLKKQHRKRLDIDSGYVRSKLNFVNDGQIITDLINHLVAGSYQFDFDTK